MADAPIQTKKRPWGRWIGFSFLILILVVVGGHAIWGWWEERKLNEEIGALRAKGEPMLIEELMNRPVAEGENAVVLLREAGEAVDEKSAAWQEFDVLRPGLPLTDKEVAGVGRVMEENKMALAKLRAARGKKGVDWQIDPSRPSLSKLRGLDEQKPLANLAADAMLLEHQQGNDREAVELARDLLAQSDALEQMPAGLLPHLIAIGVCSMACDRIFEIAADLRVGTKEGEVAPDDVKKLIDVLLDEKPLKDGQRLAMRVERANQVRGARSLRSIMPPAGGDQRRRLAIMEYVGKPMLLKDGRLLLAETTQFMNAAQESADWPDFRARTIEEIKRMNAMRQSGGHLFLGMLGAIVDRPVERTFRVMTARRLAAVALAMKLYQFEHEGKLPAKLEELVPRYLSQVPADALASGKKMGYVAGAQRPRVYSVGENGTDEGGSDAPIKKGFDSGRWWEEDWVVDLTRRPRKQLDE